VIHRDLKPSNILVSADGQVHLLDFGISKLLSPGEAPQDAQLTRLGERALTPEYAAPEQIGGSIVTTAADVYALGVVLYVLLTGQRPYRPTRESPTALEEAILQDEPVMPSRSAVSGTAALARGSTVQKLAKSLKGDLDTIVLKALRKSPRELYPTADAFGEDIARFLRGDTVLARPDTIAYRVFKFAHRHRLAIAVAGALTATLVGGLVATTYEAKVASQERDLALQSQLRSLTQTAAARLR
jgi:serine/threonine protein kinase